MLTGKTWGRKKKKEKKKRVGGGSAECVRLVHVFPVASVTVNEGVLVEAKRPLIKKIKMLESSSQRGHSILRAQKFEVPASGD